MKWNMDLHHPVEDILQRIQRCPQVSQLLDQGNKAADISWSSDSVEGDVGVNAAKGKNKSGKSKKQRGKKKKGGKK